MFTRTFKMAEKEFVDENQQDDFADTDKMPLRDFEETDFQSSMMMSNIDHDTLPIGIQTELEESRSSFTPIQTEAEKIDNKFWKFDFTDSAMDIKDGTEVKDAADDAFSKYFNK